ncbi:hypothetical protein TNCV_3425731 [Trichonephila clavipes]|nr:hypothetical protein TNCV_3425731 [Trichonephila clavipes]
MTSNVRQEGLMHVESVEVELPPVRVVWEFRERDASLRVVPVSRPKFKITRSVANSPCVASKCDVYKKSKQITARLCYKSKDTTELS